METAMLRATKLLFLVLSISSVSLAQETVLIPDGYVDVRSGKLVAGKAIIISGNRIVDIVPADNVDDKANVIGSFLETGSVYQTETRYVVPNILLKNGAVGSQALFYNFAF